MDRDNNPHTVGICTPKGRWKKGQPEEKWKQTVAEKKCREKES